MNSKNSHLFTTLFYYNYPVSREETVTIRHNFYYKTEEVKNENQDVYIQKATKNNHLTCLFHWFTLTLPYTLPNSLFYSQLL